jgi:hypothetical protein
MTNRILIEVLGGTVQAVYADNTDIQVIVYDHDNIDAGDPPPTWDDYEDVEPMRDWPLQRIRAPLTGS